MNYKTISLLNVFFCERRDLLCSESNGDISRVKIYNMFIFFTCEDIMFSRERLPGI